MPDFPVIRNEITIDGAQASFYLIPWDTEIFGVPVAQLELRNVENPQAGEVLMLQFQAWCAENDVHLCSVKCPQDQTREVFFLQEHDFRVVEIAYTPEMKCLQDIDIMETSLHVEPAFAEDEERLVALAGIVFDKGRFIADPRIGAELSNKRYATWLRNSFKSSCQKVEKIVDREDELVGFFVTETLINDTEYWHLTALVPEVIGTGISKSVWSTMMAQAQENGATCIRTSISSHNIAVHNLYIALGFRMNSPCTLLHWLRKDLPNVLQC